MEHEWDLLNPLTDMNELLADVQSGPYTLEDILAEFGTPPTSPRAASKPSPAAAPEGAPPKTRTPPQTERMQPEPKSVLDFFPLPGSGGRDPAAD